MTEIAPLYARVILIKEAKDSTSQVMCTLEYLESNANSLVPNGRFLRFRNFQRKNFTKGLLDEEVIPPTYKNVFSDYLAGNTNFQQVATTLTKIREMYESAEKELLGLS